MDGDIYVKSVDEYVLTTPSPIPTATPSPTPDPYPNIVETFEPGEHMVIYFSSLVKDEYSNDYSVIGPETEESNYHSRKSRYLKFAFDIPEGYEIYDIQTVTGTHFNGFPYTIGYNYILVNTEKVEATGVYDKNANTYYFSEPGVVVKEHTLG